jgi:monofunctional biosynthetic peptidoglycan transglycosylase
LEIQATVIMEICMSKKRMLELYFNYVEWGKGIYGIETASRYYYGKSCTNLTRTQTMKLISILTNPLRYTPETYYKSASARQRYNLLQRYF